MKIGNLIVTPVDIIDRIDDCNWSEWEVEIEHPDGRIEMGSMQGDGHHFERETLADENGNPLT